MVNVSSIRKENRYVSRVTPHWSPFRGAKSWRQRNLQAAVTVIVCSMKTTSRWTCLQVDIRYIRHVRAASFNVFAFNYEWRLWETFRLFRGHMNNVSSRTSCSPLWVDDLHFLLITWFSLQQCPGSVWTSAVRWLNSCTLSRTTTNRKMIKRPRFSNRYATTWRRIPPTERPATATCIYKWV